MLSYDLIKKSALGAGFSLCGIARARTLTEQKPRLTGWLARGYDSGLDYIGHLADERADPRAIVDGARTVVVCAVNYKNSAWDQTTRGTRPRIASYAYARDYHKSVKKMLRQVLKEIQAAYPDTSGRCVNDTAPILEKAWAVEAGLGWIGKNSLLVTPQHGSFVILGELVLDTACDRYDSPFEGERCGACTRCMDACPNGALTAPRVIDTGRCIARLTIERLPESRSVSPATLNGWLFGCDECQSYCPYNARTPLFANPAFTPVIDPGLTTAEFWRALTREQFDTLFAATPLKRAGYDRLLAALPPDGE